MSGARVGLLGFGEVGQVLGRELRARDLASFDILFADGASAPAAAIRDSRVAARDSAAELARDRDVLISAVTAADAVQAAGSVAPYMRPGAWFLDLNSVSPATRREAAELVDSTGGRYVEAAVMAPISPRGIETAILLGGPHASAFRTVAAELGFGGAQDFDERLGQASATKLCRSVIVKGLESLVSESMLAARHYGVEEEVLGSLGNLFPGADWPKLAHYLMSRSVRHGERRAAEMREAAGTVAQAGVEPLMSEACARRQARAAVCAGALEASGLTELLDAMRNQVGERSPC